MIHWLWLLPAFWAGGMLGMLLIALLQVARKNTMEDEDEVPALRNP